MPLFISRPQTSSPPSGNINYHRNTTHRSRIIGIIAVFLILIALPIIILITRYQQEIRGRASTTPTGPPTFNTAFTCGNAPTDIMLIIDRSGSMNSTLGSGITKIAAAIAAAQHFVDTVSQSTNNRIGLTTFATTASLDNPLTNNFSSVKTTIGEIHATGNTCVECGVTTTNQEITKDGRSNIKKVVILLTDGIANTIIGDPNKVASATAEAKAIAAVKSGFTTNKETFFTIGLGNKNGNSETGINEPFLMQIANLTGGKYYYSPSTDQLDQIYQSISQIVGKGSVSGYVFNDLNNNGIFDTPPDASLSAWTVNLKDETNTTTITTDVTNNLGAYSFTGLCDGNYTVSETVKTGWTQTSPINPNYYKVTIANGSALTDKNFGNIQATCGLACTSNADCSKATDGCAVCDTSKGKCSIPPSPTPISTPTTCPTPGTVTNVKIICPNCPNQETNPSPTESL